jgi:opacity protein-like surface antigen
MRKQFVSLVCGIALLGGATGAMAGAYGEEETAEETPAAVQAAPAPEPVPEIDYARLAPYIGLGGLYSVELFNDAGARVDNSSGFHVRLGYRFHRNFSAEVLYENMTSYDMDPGHFNAWAATFNGKGFLLTGRFQPYGVMGLGFMNVNGSGGSPVTAANAGDGFIMRFGAGMDAYITEHLAMGPEVAYVLPFGHVDHFDMINVSLGIRYVF